MMIQSIFILSPTGEVLIERHFRGVTSRSVCEYYWQKASASASVTMNGIGTGSSVASSDFDVPPVLEVCDHSNGTLYLFSIVRDGLSYLAACPAEVSPLLILEFLHRVGDTFQDYFGTPADESAMKENFSTVYQLLEEMLDYGWPLTTEPNALKAMIRPPTVMGKLQQAVTGTSSAVVSNVLPNGTVSNMPWRKAGVKHTSNEIYIDIIEEIDAIVDGTTGRLVSSDVSGSVQVKSRLSGVPDMLLTFRDPELIDDCSFHPCVRYGRYEKDRVVSFVPPDGLFELMRYRVRHNPNNSMSSNSHITPPIFCTPTFHYGPNSGRVTIVVGARPTNSLIYSASSTHATNTAANLSMEDIVITIPFAKAVRTATLNVNFGRVMYDEAANVAKWDMGKLDERMSTQRQPQLTGTMVLDTNITVNTDSSSKNKSNITNNSCGNGSGNSLDNPPLQLSWVAPFASVSGVAISGLTMTGERYSPFKGMRNMCKSGSYQVRCH